MGGSTNTVLHLLAVAHEAEVDFKMDDIDMLSRKTPCLWFDIRYFLIAYAFIGRFNHRINQIEVLTVSR